mmetsp:Transcript_1575/g.2183  ORF Transcript_1575/g.2183 Transcript_1575/m.2183 type:complete len:252 (-) Transcript_1575:39-794(-)
MVIQVAMAGLIGANVSHHVAETRILVQLVILDGLLACLHVLPMRQITLVHLLEQDSVGVDGLLLEVANVAMAGRWSDHICQEVGIEEEALAESDEQSVEDSRIPELQEEEKVHALVLSLLQQVVDPAVVALERPQAAQMALHAADHARHARYCLKENDSVHPAALIKLVRVIAGNHIEGLAREADHVECDVVLDRSRLLMRVLDLLDGLLRVDRVRHAVTLWVQHDSVLRHFVQKALSWLHFACGFRAGYG